MNDTISDRQRKRESLEWILELSQRDIDRVMRAHTNNGDDLSMKMIFEDCGGIETCILLWRKLSRMTLHISERPLNELKRMYIRRHYKPEDLERCTKALAAMLDCSEQFVRESLTDDLKADVRQNKLEL